MAVDISKILSDASNILSIENQILGLGQATATKADVHYLVQLFNEVLAGETQLYNQLVVLSAQIPQLYADVSALISNLPQRGEPVTLPSTPPAGYGGASPSENAAAVWQYQLPITLAETGDALNWASAILFPSLYYGKWKIGTAPYFSWATRGDPFAGALGPSGPWPSPLAANILPSDTLLSWLQREASGWTWVADPDGSDQIIAAGQNPNSYIICDLTVADFNELRMTASPLLAQGAPIWPGLANVTLGTPVALSESFTLTGPMDGIIIDISSVNPNRTRYDFNGLYTYRRIGAFAFVDDNGDAEGFIPLSFVHAVYTPSRMVSAAEVLFNLDPATVGTVTPWTRN